MRRAPAIVAVLCALVTGAAPGLAQTPGTDAPEAPISKECQTPGVEITGAVPLRAVQRALKERKTIKILTIGGSSSPLLSHGAEAPHYLIEEMLEKTITGVDVQIIDRGVSGELARDTAERLKSEVALTEPDLVLWQVGASDALAQVQVEEFEQTVDEALAWLKAHDIDVVLVGLQYLRLMRKDIQYQAIREAIRRISERNRVLRISRYEAMQVLEQARSSVGRPTPNAFAMTEAGYACLSEYVVRAVTSGIFVRPVPAKPRN
jgi:lysophospholipase L1-like esterase